MNKAWLPILAAFALAACNEESMTAADEREHRQALEMQTLQNDQATRIAQMQISNEKEMARITAEIEARAALDVAEENARAAVAAAKEQAAAWIKNTTLFVKVAQVLGVVGGIVAVAWGGFWFANRRNGHHRAVHEKDIDAGVQRYKYVVDALNDPNNGLSPEDRVRAFGMAIAHANRPRLTYDGPKAA